MEGTSRVFPGEFSRSTLSAPCGDPGSQQAVVTPGGAWCRRICLAGALTEVNDSGDMIRCRVADPTGAFDIVIGGRNTAIAETFRKLPVPSFVSLTGLAQIYQKNHTASLSVRPEHVRLIDRSTRDRITSRTPGATLGRLEEMYRALGGQCTDARVMMAFRHYGMTAAGLEELLLMVEEAVRSTCPAGTDTTEARPDARALVLELMQAKNGPGGLAVEEIIGTVSSGASPGTQFWQQLNPSSLMTNVTSPRKGFVKLL